jgi:hypothetical protein
VLAAVQEKGEPSLSGEVLAAVQEKGEPSLSGEVPFRQAQGPELAEGLAAVRERGEPIRNRMIRNF